MKTIVCIFLSFFLLSSAYSSEEFNCENGECIEGIVHRLESLNHLFTTKCLPKGIDPSKIEAHVRHFGVTEICWSYITEINQLEKKLQEQQSKLELKLGCESNDCKLPGATASLNGQLNELGKIEENLCTEPKKAEVNRQCPNDLECVLVSSAIGIGGYVAEHLLPQKYQPQNCHMGEDNCMTQLALGFLRSFMDFFEGLWDLMKAAGSYSKEKMGQFWKWATRAEDHSSTSQLSLAKASEDESIFKMFKDDFPGTVKKLWAGLVGGIKEYLKTEIFCERWDGPPHFSKCIEPAISFDCVSCKALINGMCMVSGYIIAEILPSFFTGGATTAAKQGSNGAAKIAKGFKLSKKAVTAFKLSRLGKMSKSASRGEEIVKLTKAILVSKGVVEGSLKAIKLYMTGTGRALVKGAYSAMEGLSQKGKVFLAQSASGKLIVFSGTTLVRASPVILHQIENPGSIYNFQAGQRSFDKHFKLGSPKLANKSKIIDSLLKVDPKVEGILVNLELERMRARPRPEYLFIKEEELLQRVLPYRLQVLKASIQSEDVKLPELIQTLYPELEYGDLAKKLPPEKTSAAEHELFGEINSMAPGENRDRLMKMFADHVAQGSAREKILKEPFKKPEEGTK